MADIASFVAKCNAAIAELLAIPAATPAGVRIRVTAPCKVRNGPSQPSTILGEHPVGVVGTIKPSASVPGGNPQGGYTFIDFDAAPLPPAVPGVPAALHGWAWPANFVVTP